MGNCLKPHVPSASQKKVRLLHSDGGQNEVKVSKIKSSECCCLILLVNNRCKQSKILFGCKSNFGIKYVVQYMSLNFVLGLIYITHIMYSRGLHISYDKLSHEQIYLAQLHLYNYEQQLCFKLLPCFPLFVHIYH